MRASSLEIHLTMGSYVPCCVKASRIVVRVMDDAAARIVDVLTAHFHVVACLERDRAGQIDIIFNFHRQAVPAAAAQVKKEALVRSHGPVAYAQDARHASVGCHLDARAVIEPSLVDGGVRGSIVRCGMRASRCRKKG